MVVGVDGRLPDSARLFLPEIMRKDDIISEFYFTPRATADKVKDIESAKSYLMEMFNEYRMVVFSFIHPVVAEALKSIKTKSLVVVPIYDIGGRFQRWAII